ncbi:MAG: tRNA threonylcarbamoyladenosine dehydratase [Rhodoferax sp.]
MEEGEDAQRRFGALARLWGALGAERVRHAHLVVVGIGGVGSWVAEAFARSGVGRITLVDMDHVAESNINRQVHALGSTVGMAKVHAMRERIADIQPGCGVQTVDDFVTADNWAALVPDDCDGVVDACDQLAAKVAMARWALRSKAAFVCVGAAGGKRLAHRVEVDDLGEVTHDPLLAKLRYQLRRHAGAAREGRMRVQCVFSREAVRASQDACALQSDGSLNCHGYGSSVAVTSVFGMCAAASVLEKVVVTPGRWEK